MRDGIALQSRGILVLGFSCNMLKEGRDSGNTQRKHCHRGQYTLNLAELKLWSWSTFEGLANSPGMQGGKGPNLAFGHTMPKWWSWGRGQGPADCQDRLPICLLGRGL